MVMDFFIDQLYFKMGYLGIQDDEEYVLLWWQLQTPIMAPNRKRVDSSLVQVIL